MSLRIARPRHGLLPLFIPLAALAWVTRGLLGGEFYGERDQLYIFHPLKRYLAERLRAGDFPDWWPWDGLGQPLAAIPVASVFHPSTLGYLALPFEWAYSLQTLLPFPVALLGAFALARTLGLRRWAAALAAGLFTAGFYFVALSEQTQMHLAAMSLPWVWRESIRLAQSRRVPLWGLAIAVANLVLGGDPMLLELAVLTSAPFVLAVGPRRAALARVAAAVTLGVVLGAVQWVPMLFAWAESPRSAGLGIDTSDFWAVRPEHVVGMVVPGHFKPETFLFESTYLGLLSLGLVVIGATRPWRWRWPLVGVVALSVWLSVGRAAGLWSVFALVVPGWSGFQFPAKALSAAALALPLLAARGMMVALRAPRAAGAFLALLALVGVVTQSWASSALVLTAAVLVVASRAVPRARAPVAWAGLLVLVVLDQLLHGARIETRPWASLEAPRAVNALVAAGVRLGGQRYVHAWNVKPFEDRNEGMVHELASLRPATGARWGLPSAVPYLQGFTRRYYDVALADKSAWLSKRAGLFATSAFIVNAQVVRPEQQARVMHAEPAHDLVVLRASRALPAAYVAFGIQRVPEVEAPARLGGPGFVVGRDVLVPADGDWAVPESFEQQAGLPILPVEAVRHLGDTVELEVSLERPGILVWNEAFTAATEVLEGEQSLPIFPVNHAVLGVALPAGSHRLVVQRRTPGLWEGLGLTLAGALTLVIRRTRR